MVVSCSVIVFIVFQLEEAPRWFVYSCTEKEMKRDVNCHMSWSLARNAKPYQAFAFVFVPYVMHFIGSDIRTALCTCASCESLGTLSSFHGRGRLCVEAGESFSLWCS